MRWPTTLPLIAVAACGRANFDAIPGDGSTTGDSSDSSASVGPCEVAGNTLICDNFEGPSLDRWFLRGGVSRVSSPTHSGSGAVRAIINSASESAALIARPATLPNEPRLSVRFWIYITGASSLAQANLASFYHAPSGEELTVVGFTDQLRVWRETSTNAGYTGPVLPRDEWVCIELAATIDDVNGALQAWMNNVVVASDAGPVDTNGNGFDELQIGLPFSDFVNQGAITVYLDDVHVGTQPVGCQ